MPFAGPGGAGKLRAQYRYLFLLQQFPAAPLVRSDRRLLAARRSWGWADAGAGRHRGSVAFVVFIALVAAG
jgi:hypothetical protein